MSAPLSTGADVSRELDIDADVNNQIATASAAFEKLTEIIKLKVYRLVVLITVLHACKT